MPKPAQNGDRQPVFRPQKRVKRLHLARVGLPQMSQMPQNEILRCDKPKPFSTGDLRDFVTRHTCFRQIPVYIFFCYHTPIVPHIPKIPLSLEKEV